MSFKLQVGKLSFLCVLHVLAILLLDSNHVEGVLLMSATKGSVAVDRL